MGRSKQKAVTIDEFDITLRGARVVRVRSNGAVPVGTVLPWTLGMLRESQGACSIEFRDQSGEVCAFARIPQSRARIVKRAIARARREALRRGDYEITVAEQKSGRVFAIIAVLACVVLMVLAIIHILLPITQRILASAGQASPWWMDVVVIVSLWFFMLHLPLIGMAFAISVARRNVRVFHVSRDGFVATTREGNEWAVSWAEVRDLHWGLTGFTVRADGLPTLRMKGGHASFILQDWANKVSHRRRASLGRLLITGFVLFQLGGAVAYLMHQSGVPVGVATHPIVAYALVGWMIPAAFALQMILWPMIRRFEERNAKRKRREKRRQTPREDL